MEDLGSVSPTFADAVAQIKVIALREFDREVIEKQLCYHTRSHIAGVQRRADQIFQVVRPYLPSAADNDHLALLLDLCAVTHDLVQIFVPSPDPHAPRHREAGISEAATLKRILDIINSLNSQDRREAPLFSEADLQTIREAIAATICDFDPTEQAIFQPFLYQQQSISWIARILALADIGALGMEGIAAYNLEGGLLFLEENPDVRSLIEHHQFKDAIANDPALSENIRQRLLKRARFQVNLAKSRLQRCPQELAAFPPETIPILTQQVFRYLTPETIQAIATTTPTADYTPLERLTHFFQLEPILATVTP